MNKEDILEIQALMMYNKDLKMELEICQQSIKDADNTIRGLKATVNFYENKNEILNKKIRDYEAGIISDCPMCDCEDNKE